MQSRRVKVAGLSSLNTTVFFICHPKAPQVLFVSQICSYSTIMVMNFVAMFALSLGITSLDDADVLSFDTKEWHYLDNFYLQNPSKSPGLDTRYVVICLCCRIATHRMW